MADSLTLKWGTIKAWRFESEAARAAAKIYAESGKHSASTMLHRDTPEMKKALCDLIDAIDGEIDNDWTGEVMTKDEAKAYVMEYDT